MNLLSATTTAGAIVSLCAVIVLALFAILGLKQGFVKSFLKTFGTLLALLFAVLLCSKFADFLQDKFGLLDTMSNWVSGLLSKNNSDLLNKTWGEVSTQPDLTGIIGWVVGKIVSNNGITIEATQTLNSVISPVLGRYALLAISILGLFILFKIIFFIIGQIFKALSKIKLIGFTDKLLGLLLGLIRGIIFIQLFCILVNLIPIDAVKTFAGWLNESVIVNIVSKINIFEFILSKINFADLENVVNSVLQQIKAA